MIYYVKLLQYENKYEHSLWSVQEGEHGSIEIYEEVNTPFSSLIDSLGPDDRIITIDGEYILGRYSFDNDSIVKNIVPYDIIYYLTQRKKFTVSNLLYYYRSNTDKAKDIHVHSEHRRINFFEFIEYGKDERYLSSFCFFIKVFHESKSGKTLLGDFFSDEKLLNFYINYQIPICQNTYKYNSTCLHINIPKSSLKDMTDYEREMAYGLWKKNGIVYADYYPLSTITGRLTAYGVFDPQKMPKVIRKHIHENIHGVGDVLSMDIKNAEPRIMFDISGNELAYDDIYTGIQEDLSWGDMNRDDIKTTFYVFMYGYARNKKSKKIKQLQKLFPEVDRFIDQLMNNAQKNKKVYNFFGRKIQYDNTDVSTVVNHYIQSTFTDMFQKVINLFHQNVKKDGLNSKILCSIQDEFLLYVAPNESDKVFSAIESARNIANEISGFGEDVIVFDIKKNY